MSHAAITLLLLVALLAGLRAVTAGSLERLLWGSLLGSICLGLAVQLQGGGYYGLLMVAVFAIADLTLYLFLRSLKLLPDRPVRHALGDRIFRVFFLWFALCGVAGTAFLAFSAGGTGVWDSPGAPSLGLLSAKAWGDDWLLLALPILGFVILVTGGFFLVRREEP